MVSDDRKYRVGIIGLAHMHINFVAAYFAEHPQVDWVACADTAPLVPELREATYTRGWNKKNVMAKFGIPKAYDDYHEMLEKERFDIIIVSTENWQHANVVEACAGAGVRFCCVEKPMAMSLSGALRMVRACEASGTQFIVNWGSSWSPAMRTAKKLLDEGVIGRVLEVKFRAGHTGPLGPGARHPGVVAESALLSGPERGATWWHQAAAGGGAMLDFTSNGCVLSRWYVGDPAVAAFGLRANLNSQYGDADDNAVIVIRFPGAIAICESSFTTWDHGVPLGPVVYGTEGTLVLDGWFSEKVRVERGGGQTTLYDPEPLPQGRHQVAFELIHHLNMGEPLFETTLPAFNLESMGILDAAIRSAASGKMELVNHAAWRIG